jgi:hypothetical protein
MRNVTGLAGDFVGMVIELGRLKVRARAMTRLAGEEILA